MEVSALYPDCDFSIWFRSVNEDSTTVTPIQGRKTGVIPSWIHGSLYQNGPGLLDVTGERVKHLFDAFALIQKFTIENGEVTYQNRILKSDAYQKALLTKKSHYAEYGTGKSDSKSSMKNLAKKSESTTSWLLSRIRQLITAKNDFRTDNAMISIYPYVVDKDSTALYAMTETTIMHQVDPDTIETRNNFNVSDYLPVVTHCAHPALLNDGTIINVGLGSSFMGMNYVLFEFPGHPKTITNDNLMKHCRVLAKIPSRWPFNPSYMHTFAVTENYVVLIEQSLCVSLTQMVQVTITNEPMTNALAWHGDEPVRFRLIDRRTMREKVDHVYLTEAFFYLHSINAYEDDDHLVIDICCYENAEMLNCMTIQALEEAQQNPFYRNQFCGRPKRFVLPLLVGNDPIGNLVHLKYTTCQVTSINGNKLWIDPELILDVGCELPQINHHQYFGKFYRYFYAINSDIDYEYCGAIRKIDILSKTCQIWYEANCYASEPIFLHNPYSDENRDEDDGVLIISLLRSHHVNEVSLVVINARDMTEIGRVQFQTQGPVPKCLHGLWNETPVN